MLAIYGSANRNFLENPDILRCLAHGYGVPAHTHSAHRYRHGMRNDVHDARVSLVTLSVDCRQTARPVYIGVLTVCQYTICQ